MSETLANDVKIAVVGGGIAGSTLAIYLSELGLNVSLFEQGSSLVSGPPICHLHAGGNLYREISDEQCITLLRESIDLVRFYPDAVDYRPTVVAVPQSDSGSPEDLYPRLKRLQKEYGKLIKKDVLNKVLGESSDYYKLYNRQTLEALQIRKTPKNPHTMDEWMIPVAKNIDLDSLQFPLIMVQEYGLNLFRLASSAQLRLENKKQCRLLFHHKVTRLSKNSESGKWLVGFTNENNSHEEAFDYLINAAGFRTGKLDDMLGYKKERLVEFKAAYVSQWDNGTEVWPEVIFYGERGTPKGMAQLTPYPNGHFQLHGMTKSITLFEEGLVKSSSKSAQPQLNKEFLDKIDDNWSFEASQTRSQRAINHMAQYIPSFSSAKVVSKPLYGAQQIPGLDSTLRAADVSFEEEGYARCEIVKASSVLSVADSITKQLIILGFVDESLYGARDFKSQQKLEDKEVTDCAKSLCHSRTYPLALAQRVVPQ